MSARQRDGWHNDKAAGTCWIMVGGASGDTRVGLMMSAAVCTQPSCLQSCCQSSLHTPLQAILQRSEARATLCKLWHTINQRQTAACSGSGGSRNYHSSNSSSRIDNSHSSSSSSSSSSSRSGEWAHLRPMPRSMSATRGRSPAANTSSTLEKAPDNSAASRKVAHPACEAENQTGSSSSSSSRLLQIRDTT